MDLIERARLATGARVLDVACGTGVVARKAAERVGSTVSVAALDINPGMLAVARSLPAVPGAVIEWQEGSALALPFPAATFDAVLCQLGLQFFPDQPTALREMRRVLVPDGRLILSVFGPIEHYPGNLALANALDAHLGTAASVAKRAEHAPADAAALQMLVARAGFQQVEIRTTTQPVRFPSSGDYVRFQLAATPLATLITHQEPARRDAVVNALVQDVCAALEPYVGGEGLALPQEVHYVLANS